MRGNSLINVPALAWLPAQGRYSLGEDMWTGFVLAF